MSTITQEGSFTPGNESARERGRRSALAERWMNQKITVIVAISLIATFLGAALAVYAVIEYNSTLSDTNKVRQGAIRSSIAANANINRDVFGRAALLDDQVYGGDSREFADSGDRARRSQDEYEEALALIRRDLLSPEEAALLDEVVTLNDQYEAITPELYDLIEAGDQARLLSRYEERASLLYESGDKLRQITASVNTRVDDFETDVRRRGQFIQYSAGALLALAVLSTVLAWSWDRSPSQRMLKKK